MADSAAPVNDRHLASAVHVSKVVRRRLRSNGEWNINDWKDVADALSRAVLDIAGEDPHADA